MNMKLIILVVGFALASVAYSVDIQDVYNACGPGNGYDKYLDLDPAVSYEGRLVVDSGMKSAIVGNGASVNLGPYGYLYAEGENTVLDVDHLVIYGNDRAPGIYYEAYSMGTVDSCTVDGCQFGVLAWIDTVVTIRNCIFTNSTEYGVGQYEGAKTTISYCDVWGSTIDSYGEFCPD
jgi:hypothetical protein